MKEEKRPTIPGFFFPLATSLYSLASGIVLRLLVGVRFQVLFHSPSGVLFTFPSRYWFTIGGRRYLALPGGPGRFPQGFSCPVVLGFLAKSPVPFAYRAFTPYGRPFHAVRLKMGFLTLLRRLQSPHARPRNPYDATPAGFYAP